MSGAGEWVYLANLPVDPGTQHILDMAARYAALEAAADDLAEAVEAITARDASGEITGLWVTPNDPRNGAVILALRAYRAARGAA